MINAHPTILHQFCKRMIKRDALEIYVNYRDEVIKTIMNKHPLEKGDVKQLFLYSMNGGKRDCITGTFFVKFKYVDDIIHKCIASLNQNHKTMYAKEKISMLMVL